MAAFLILDESAVWQFSVFHDGLLDPPANEQKAFELELAVAGIEVVDSISLEIPDNLEVGRQDPRAPIEITKKLKTAGVDAVVASACVQMPSLSSIQAIEDRVGVPVLSSSVATTYMMLKKLGLKTYSPGYGALLSGRY